MISSSHSASTCRTTAHGASGGEAAGGVATAALVLVRRCTRRPPRARRRALRQPCARARGSRATTTPSRAAHPTCRYVRIFQGYAHEVQAANEAGVPRALLRELEPGEASATADWKAKWLAAVFREAMSRAACDKCASWRRDSSAAARQHGLVGRRSLATAHALEEPRSRRACWGAEPKWLILPLSTPR